MRRATGAQDNVGARGTGHGEQSPRGCGIPVKPCRTRHCRSWKVVSGGSGRHRGTGIRGPGKCGQSPL